MSKMTENYREQLEAGVIYQDFVYEILSKNGINTVSYGSKLFQYLFGENKAGIEIKFDDWLKKTGNLWIEVAEKTNPNQPEYFTSGIYRDCNEYVIGDYSTIYRLSTNIIRMVAAKGNYPIKENNMKTSKGFLLPQTEADRISISVYRPNMNEKMEKIINSHSYGYGPIKYQAAQDMLSAMNCNPSQPISFEIKDIQ